MKYYLGSLVLVLIMSCSSDYTEEVEALNVQMEILSDNSPLVNVNLLRRVKDVSYGSEGLGILANTETCNILTYRENFLYNTETKEIFNGYDLKNQDDGLFVTSYHVTFYFGDTLLFLLSRGGVAAYLDNGKLNKYQGEIADHIGFGGPFSSNDMIFKNSEVYVYPLEYAEARGKYQAFNIRRGNRPQFYHSFGFCNGEFYNQEFENKGMLYFDDYFYGYAQTSDSLVACKYDSIGFVENIGFESELISKYTELKYVDGAVYAYDSIGTCVQLEQKSPTEFAKLETPCDKEFDSRLGWVDEDKAVVFDSVKNVKIEIPKEVKFWESKLKTELPQRESESCD